MYRAGFILVVACAACSSGGSSTAPTVNTSVAPEELHTMSGSMNLATVDDKNIILATILAPVDSVWRVLPGVFLELAIEPGTVNPKEHVISNTSFSVRRSLGGVRVSRYVECGSTIAGATADMSTVTMSLIVQVVPDSVEVSSLHTQMSAFAVTDGASVARIRCGTTGQLEARIARMVSDALKHRAKK